MHLPGNDILVRSNGLSAYALTIRTGQPIQINLYAFTKGIGSRNQYFKHSRYLLAALSWESLLAECGRLELSAKLLRDASKGKAMILLGMGQFRWEIVINEVLHRWQSFAGAEQLHSLM